jgi:hypothetical protein
VGVVGADPSLRVERTEHASVETPLLTAAEDGGVAPALGRPAAHANAARRGRARRRDLGTVHDRGRQAGLGVVHDDEAGDIGKPPLLVCWIPGDPLEGRDVVVLEVGRHRVDERVFARMDAGLRRQLHTPLADGAVRGLDEVELIGDRREEARHLGAPQIEKAHIW